MKKIAWLFLLLSIFASPAWGLPPPEVDPDLVVTLLISANVHGEVEPCG